MVWLNTWSFWIWFGLIKHIVACCPDLIQIERGLNKYYQLVVAEILSLKTE
jgi:hypothetical protein